MITVYVKEITPRIDYAFRLIFETILKNEVQFTSDEILFKSVSDAKINYSETDDLGGLFLRPHGILNQNHLQMHYPDLVDWEGEKALFSTTNSFIPFDLFAASFFLVSRFEEYFPGKRDSHNRFMARHSYAGTNGFLEKPVVNIWALKLAHIIEERYKDVTFKRTKFKYVPTIDIDNAWAFKNKGIFRIFMSTGKDIMKGRFSTLKKRFLVVTRVEKDPYDSYDFLSSIFSKYNFRPTYFFLLNNQGKRDRSLSHRNLQYRSLILQLGKKGKIGLHPSYASTRSDNQLIKEIKRFTDITGKPVKRSRQHFLKITLPTTYRRLVDHNVKADYSMCFASRPGFRASIATPFYWFDITKDKTTALKIHPFQVMETTLLHYRSMRTTDAIKKIKSIMDETAKVGGTFCSLWHNESLNDNGQWKGWREVYIQMTAHAANIRDGKEDSIIEE